MPHKDEIELQVLPKVLERVSPETLRHRFGAEVDGDHIHFITPAAAKDFKHYCEQAHGIKLEG